ncbi:MAG: hypothetical protein K2I90_09385 [Odoribacter sp.]|nr:hypothetical protein [Odoribacter sp.]
MKKYDVYLLMLYVLPIIAFLMIASGFKRMESRELKKGVRYFEEIYRAPIKTVVLHSTPVNRTGEGTTRTENGLEFIGSLDVKYLDCFKVSGDTLVVSERKWFGLRLNVDTIKAPGLKIERVEAERSQDGI